MSDSQNIPEPPIDRSENFKPGHNACAGCGGTITIRLALKAAHEVNVDDIAVAQATGCMEVVSSAYPQTSWNVPWVHGAFETAGSIASGMEASLKKQNKDTKVIAFAGDGGTADIGFQALSGMMERGHDVTYIMYDNEAYMNTGIQRSSSTPYGAWTTTSPPGDVDEIGSGEPKKPMTMLAAGHGIPYAASASIGYYQDYYNKVKKAVEVDGPAFIQVYSSCPTGWKSKPANTIDAAKKVVETGMWILYEVEDGLICKPNITYKPSEFKPIEEYLKTQGRFEHITGNEEAKNQLIDYLEESWARLGEEVELPR